jgi:hypothetical protein
MSPDSGNAFSITISGDTSMFDLRYQRHSRHSGRLAERVPTRSGYTLCDDDRRLAVAVGLANLLLLPTTSFPAFVFIVLIICMLAFRIFAESCQSRATSSWNCPRIQSKLAHCPTVVGGFIQRTLEASKCAIKG